MINYRVPWSFESGDSTHSIASSSVNVIVIGIWWIRSIPMYLCSIMLQSSNSLISVCLLGILVCWPYILIFAWWDFCLLVSFYFTSYSHWFLFVSRVLLVCVFLFWFEFSISCFSFWFSLFLLVFWLLLAHWLFPPIPIALLVLIMDVVYCVFIVLLYSVVLEWCSIFYLFIYFFKLVLGSFVFLSSSCFIPKIVGVDIIVGVLVVFGIWMVVILSFLLFCFWSWYFFC